MRQGQALLSVYLLRKPAISRGQVVFLGLFPIVSGCRRWNLGDVAPIREE